MSSVANAIKGEKLRIKVGGSLIALATSCTVHLSAQTEDSSTKDDYDPAAGAQWQNNAITGLSWEMTSDSLVGQAKHALMTAMLSGQEVQVEFVEVTGGSVGQYNTSTVYSGSAYITDVTVTATNKQNSTCSATLTGNGKLTASS